MTKLKSLIALVLGAASVCCAQSAGTPTTGPGNTAGILWASNFSQWQVQQGNQGPFSWSDPSFCRATASGILLVPVFKVGTPITIVDTGTPSNSEEVTPTAVNLSGSGCSITVNPANKHNTFYLTSATAGLQEAINYAGNLPYQVLLTPDWQRLGGTTGMIVAATGNASVTILDQRSSVIVPYTWTGSAYVAQPFGGGGSGTVGTGTMGQVAYYPANGNVVAGETLVPISAGGTASATAAAALANLGGLPTTGGTITGNLRVAGAFQVDTSALFSWITGSVQCLQVSNTGQVSGTGAPCGSGSGGGLADPGSNGIVKRTSFNVTAIANSGDIIATFNSGTCAGWLYFNGTCSVSIPATNVSAGVLQNGVQAVTQPINDASNDVTTDAFLQRQIGNSLVPGAQAVYEAWMDAPGAGTVLHDQSGNGNNCTFAAGHAPSWAQNNTALAFLGAGPSTTQWINCPAATLSGAKTIQLFFLPIYPNVGDGSSEYANLLSDSNGVDVAYTNVRYGQIVLSSQAANGYQVAESDDRLLGNSDWAITCTLPAATIYVNGHGSTGALYSAACPTFNAAGTVTFGEYSPLPGNGFQGTFYLYAAAIYNTVLTPQQISQNHTYIASQLAQNGGAAFIDKYPPYALVYQGDSITENHGQGGGFSNSMQYFASNQQPGREQWYDWGIAGAPLAAIVADIGNNEYPVLKSFPSESKTVVLMAGINDFLNSANAATTYAYLQTYCSDLHNAIPGSRVIVSTIFPANQLASVAGSEAARETYNSDIIAGQIAGTLGCDGVMDLGNDPTMGTQVVPNTFNPTGASSYNGTWYTDGVHPTAAGNNETSSLESFAILAGQGRAASCTQVKFQIPYQVLKAANTASPGTSQTIPLVQLFPGWQVCGLSSQVSTAFTGVSTLNMSIGDSTGSSTQYAGSQSLTSTGTALAASNSYVSAHGVVQMNFTSTGGNLSALTGGNANITIGLVVGAPAGGGSGGSGTLNVNGTPVTSPNLQNSASVTFAASGSNIQATATGGSGSGTVTASPQFQIPYYPTSGTVATIVGDAAFTDNGNGGIQANTLSVGTGADYTVINTMARKIATLTTAGQIYNCKPSLSAGSGTGYVVTDVVTIVQSGASGGTCTVASVNGTGGITSFTANTVVSGVVTANGVTTSGSVYSTASGLATTGGTGTGATVNILVDKTGDNTPVADGATASDCGTGGGGFVHYCYWNGSSWLAAAPFLLTGTTSTITGTSLSATCDSGTATVTGAIAGRPVAVSSTTGADVGGAFYLRGSVTSSNTVTVYVCGTGTPSSLAYNVTVF